jgi:hypothetical protein
MLIRRPLTRAGARIRSAEAQYPHLGAVGRRSGRVLQATLERGSPGTRTRPALYCFMILRCWSGIAAIGSDDVVRDAQRWRPSGILARNYSPVWVVTGCHERCRPAWDRAHNDVVALSRDAWVGIAVSVFLTVAAAGSAPWWWKYVDPPASRSRSKLPISYAYIVNPKQWAPPPVPGLTLARGDVVSIKATSGQWLCATVAGWAGIQGNPHYTATNHSWAVPSAPFCSLIGKIDDGPWQELGIRPQFVADRSGPLALTVNELMPKNCPQPPGSTSCYRDNRGAIKILITIR